MILRVQNQPMLTWQEEDQTVGQDCVLLCDSGSVPVHSALLAGSSSLLSSVLTSPSLCAGCTAPRSVLLPGVSVTEARVLVQLLYTGSSPLHTPLRTLHATESLVRLLSLAEALGISLSGLTATTSQGVIRIHEHSEGDKVEEQEEEEEQEDELRNGTPPLPDAKRFRSDSDDVIEDIIDRDSTKSPLFSIFEINKEAPDSPLPEEDLNDDRLSTCSPPSVVQPSLLSSPKSRISPSEVFPRARSPSSPPPGPQARVLMSDTVLHVMDIKQEILEDEVVSELEGREDEETDEEEEEEEYPDMDNYGRNYICIKCSKGFTFAKSFNWHTSRCTGEGARGRRTENSSGKRDQERREESKEQERKEERGKKEVNANLDTETSLSCQARNSRSSTRTRSITPRKDSLSSNKSPNKEKIPPSNENQLSPKKIDLQKRIEIKKDLYVKKVVTVTNKIAEHKVIDKKDLSSSKRNSIVSEYRSKNIVKLAESENLVDISKKKIDIAKIVDKTKKELDKKQELAQKPLRLSCGRCVKCRLADCGRCVACLTGSKVVGLRGCIRKVCRNKSRRSVKPIT